MEVRDEKTPKDNIRYSFAKAIHLPIELVVVTIMN
jgi:hypothetical protein